MLGQISFNILKNNMNDATENTLSKSESKANQRVRMDTPNSRAVQRHLGKLQVYNNRNLKKVNKEKHKFCTGVR